MAVSFNKKELKTLIHESVKEIFDTEFMKLRALLLPDVSSKEQKDIEEEYGVPSGERVETIEVTL